MTLGTFPVLWPYIRAQISAAECLGCPRSVPWDMLNEHRRQCFANHGQTPERLAERGGLAPSEMVAVLEDRRFRAMTNSDAVSRLNDLVESWKAAHEA